MNKRQKLCNLIARIALWAGLAFLIAGLYLEATAAQELRTHPKEDNLLDLHVYELQTPEVRSLLAYPELGTYTGEKKKEPCDKTKGIYRVYDPSPVNRDRNRWLWERSKEQGVDRR